MQKHSTSYMLEMDRGMVKTILSVLALVCVVVMLTLWVTSRLRDETCQDTDNTAEEVDRNRLDGKERKVTMRTQNQLKLKTELDTKYLEVRDLQIFDKATSAKIQNSRASLNDRAVGVVHSSKPDRTQGMGVGGHRHTRHTHGQNMMKTIRSANSSLKKEIKTDLTDGFDGEFRKTEEQTQTRRSRV